MAITPEQAQRNQRVFNEKATELFGKKHALFVLEVSLRQFMGTWSIGWEEANALLASHGVQFVEKEPYRWFLEERRVQKPIVTTGESTEQEPMPIRYKAPTRIQVKGDIPRATKSGPKNDSDNQYYRLDQDA